MVANNGCFYAEEKYTNLTWQGMLRICIIKYNEVTAGSVHRSGCLKENDHFKESFLGKEDSPNIY